MKHDKEMIIIFLILTESCEEVFGQTLIAEHCRVMSYLSVLEFKTVDGHK